MVSVTPESIAISVVMRYVPEVQVVFVVMLEVTMVGVADVVKKDCTPPYPLPFPFEAMAQ
jgi:hypothetical protein